MELEFDYRCAKMPEEISNTRLLEVIKTHHDNLSPEFRVYDTEYDVGYYALPDTDLLLLLLVSYEENVSGGYNERMWTTLRRFSQQKEKYYKSIRGKQIKINIIQDASTP